jgi:hypothetical protein
MKNALLKSGRVKSSRETSRINGTHSSPAGGVVKSIGFPKPSLLPDFKQNFKKPCNFPALQLANIGHLIQEIHSHMPQFHSRILAIKQSCDDDSLPAKSRRRLPEDKNSHRLIHLHKGREGIPKVHDSL